MTSTTPEPVTLPPLFERWRFTVLFACLIALLLAVPVADLLGSDLPFEITVSLVLIGGLGAVIGRRSRTLVAIALCGSALVLRWAGRIWPEHMVATIALLGFAAFIAFTIAILLRDVYRQREVGLDTVSQALCVYLLMAVGWASLHELIAHLDPGAYALADGSVAEVGRHDPGLVLYFSLVTITTVGYGDIAPAAPAARMASGIEALTGQLFLAVTIARLVGLTVAAPGHRAKRTG